MSYGDMTDYAHATIIGVLLRKLIQVFIAHILFTLFILIIYELLCLSCHFAALQYITQGFSYMS